MAGQFTAALLVPTGVGCAIGGYAGDAIPVARALAGLVDRLITHPNVLNGAQLYWPMDNVLYVEGYALDQFAAGHWALDPVRSNRIGVVLDCAIEPDLRLRHLQAMDAARATLGLTLTDYCLTDMPLGVTLKTSDSGATWGTLDNPDSLLRAAEKLITQAGAEAIAVVARFPDDLDSPMLQDYRQGHGVDPIAGAEAVISHLVVRAFQVPCAHAPALQPLPLDASISPRSAAEELGHTFLPCVLVGLSRAPRYQSRYSSVGQATTNQGSTSGYPHWIHAHDVDVVLTPATACGGSALLSWGSSRATVIVVEDNLTALAVRPEPLGLQVISVRSYLEGLGLVACLKAGLDPRALVPHISSLQAI
jgi:hypothetical protein